MSKTIVICSDGTGNSAASLSKTNVWRLYRALDLSESPSGGEPRQVAIYRDGVGTSSFKPLALLGGVFGLGLTRNVVDLYKFLCRTYEPGDRVFAFGFSRGAFTIRVLVALVLNQGVLRCPTEEGLDRYARDAYRAYRRRYKLPLVQSKRRYDADPDRYQDQTVGFVDWLRNGRDTVIRAARRLGRKAQYEAVPKEPVPTVAFVGVWDTVAAYGLPLDELTRGIDEWIWPLSMPNYVLSPRVEKARHALALDEERDSFRPLLWDEGDEARHGDGLDERLQQVWFAGVHSNVGGGYPDDTLSYVPLNWMMAEAAAAGLRFNPQALREAYPPADPHGRLYDSRAGIGSYYRYQPRRLGALLLKPKSDTLILRDPRRGRRGFLRDAIVHDSVLARIGQGRDRYAPVGLNEVFRVASTRAAPPCRTGTMPAPVPAASPARQWLWNDVWRRRVVYFATVLVSVLLALLPVAALIWPPTACEGPPCVLAGPVRAVGTVLPGLAEPWIDAFARRPGTFVALSFLLWFLMSAGAALKQRIRDDARALWAVEPGAAAPPSRGRFDVFIRDLRGSRRYQRAFQALKWRIGPGMLGASLLLGVWLAVAAVPYLAWARWAVWRGERTGAVCALAPAGRRGADGLGPLTFSTRTPCWETGLRVDKGRRYRLTLAIGAEWFDDTIPATPLGFAHERPRWWALPAVLLRRSLADRRFQPILRLRKGPGTVFLQPLAFESGGERRFTAEFEPGATGDVTLFVNDAVFAWGLTSRFYDDNAGTATVSLVELRPGQAAPVPVPPGGRP